MTPLSFRRKTKTAPISRRLAPTYFRGAETDARKPSPFKRKSPLQKSKWLIKTVDWMFIIVVVLILIYSLVVNPMPRVVSNSFAYHPAGDYATVASQKLSSLTNRNKITLNEQTVINQVMQRFPEVSGASLELPLLSQHPILRLNISSPSIFLQNRGVNYIVDADGRAVAKNTTYPNIKNLPQVIDSSGFSASVGEQVLSSASVKFISTVIDQCKHSGITVKTLTLPQAAQELDMTTTDQPYFVKFYLGGDALTQVGQFLAVRHQFSLSHTQPTSYVDVRVPGKVFYK